MKAAGGSLLDLLGLALVVAGAGVLFGVGVGLIAAGAAVLIVSWATNRGRSS